VLHSQDSLSGNALAQLVERGCARGFIRTVHHLDQFTYARLTAWQSRGFRAADRVLCVSRAWLDRLRNDGVEALVVNNGPRSSNIWRGLSSRSTRRCVRALRC